MTIIPSQPDEGQPTAGINKAKLSHIMRRIKRGADTINAALSDARTVWPEAQLYLDGTQNLNLMSGDSHTGLNARARQDRILGHVRLKSDGGDW